MCLTDSRERRGVQLVTAGRPHDVCGALVSGGGELTAQKHGAFVSSTYAGPWINRREWGLEACPVTRAVGDGRLVFKGWGAVVPRRFVPRLERRRRFRESHLRGHHRRARKWGKIRACHRCLGTSGLKRYRLGVRFSELRWCQTRSPPQPWLFKCTPRRSRRRRYPTVVGGRSRVRLWSGLGLACW